MTWSFKIARIAGIDVRIHATFVLLLALMAAFSGHSGAVTFTCLVFGCVLLHEFGHAFAARRYGIRTPDITLLPIGGVARLDRMPDHPSEEIIVAIAGPLVNVAIAALLWLCLGFPTDLFGAGLMPRVGASLPRSLLVVNLSLVLFNLIPAFPMDGGRILRAVLAMLLEYSRATHIAAALGQACAFAFAFWALRQHPVNLGHVLVAAFIYYAAANEASLAMRMPPPLPAA